MRRMVRSGVLVCLLSLGSRATAQTVPATGDAWPEVTQPEAPPAPVTQPDAPPAPVTQAASPTAPAAESPPSAAPQPQPPPAATFPSDGVHQEWYGWQTLTVDGAALLLATLGLAASAGDQGSGGDGTLTLATGLFLLGGPVVHFAHENVTQGFASLGLRVATPVLFALVGYGVQKSSCGGNLCGLGGLVYGGALGILVAIGVDAAVLAREDVPDRQSALPRLRLALDRDGAGVTASGSF